MEEAAVCAACGAAGASRCGTCKAQRYCGRDHQRQHWAVHRAACGHMVRLRGVAADAAAACAAAAPLPPRLHQELLLCVSAAVDAAAAANEAAVLGAVRTTLASSTGAQVGWDLVDCVVAAIEKAAPTAPSPTFSAACSLLRALCAACNAREAALALSVHLSRALDRAEQALGTAAAKAAALDAGEEDESSPAAAALGAAASQAAVQALRASGWEAAFDAVLAALAALALRVPAARRASLVRPWLGLLERHVALTAELMEGAWSSSAAAEAALLVALDGGAQSAQQAGSGGGERLPQWRAHLSALTQACAEFVRQLTGAPPEVRGSPMDQGWAADAERAPCAGLAMALVRAAPLEDAAGPGDALVALARACGVDGAVAGTYALRRLDAEGVFRSVGGDLNDFADSDAEERESGADEEDAESDGQRRAAVAHARVGRFSGDDEASDARAASSLPPEESADDEAERSAVRAEVAAARAALLALPTWSLESSGLLLLRALRERTVRADGDGGRVVLQCAPCANALFGSPLAEARWSAQQLVTEALALVAAGRAAVAPPAADVSAPVVPALPWAEGDLSDARASALWSLTHSLSVCVVRWPQPERRRAALDALRGLLGLLAPALRVVSLQRLLASGPAPSLAALLWSQCKQEFADHWPSGAAPAAPRWFLGLAAFLEQQLRASQGHEEGARDWDALGSALNVLRFLLLREAAGGTDHTMVRVRVRALAREVLQPLRQALQRPQALAGGGHAAMVLATLERVLEIAEEAALPAHGGTAPSGAAQ